MPSATPKPRPAPEPSFVVAGSGEAPEGRGNYRDHIVRLGDVTPAGIREKARFVLGEMERRMAALGFTLEGHDGDAGLHGARHPSVSRRRDRAPGRGALGLTWHYNRPPVVDLEYEMDCRGVSIERIA